MTIENSYLNRLDSLPESEEHLHLNSGDGNAPSLAALKRGFQRVADPATAPHFYPQNADDGENYVGNPFAPDGGFLGRPEGWER